MVEFIFGWVRHEKGALVTMAGNSIAPIHSYIIKLNDY